MSLRLVRAALALLAAAVLAGCAAPWQTSEPVAPVSYQTSRERIPRVAGRLRRMVVLQLEQSAPRSCGAATDSVITVQHAASSLRSLVEERGYEVHEPEATSYAPWLAAPDNAVFLAEVAQWSPRRGEVAAGPSTRALLDRLRTDDRIDGLLVVLLQHTCENADTLLRGFVSVATLGLHAISPDPRLLVPQRFYRAVIFASSSARPVWDNSLNTANIKMMDFFTGRDTRQGTPGELERLLEALESATPKLLTR
jgi:hypothetical protein